MSTKNTVWIVEKGSNYDDSPWEIEGVFHSEKEADKYIASQTGENGPYTLGLFHKSKWTIQGNESLIDQTASNDHDTLIKALKENAGLKSKLAFAKMEKKKYIKLVRELHYIAMGLPIKISTLKNFRERHNDMSEELYMAYLKRYTKELQEINRLLDIVKD